MSYYGIDNDFEDEITGIPEDFEDDLEIEEDNDEHIDVNENTNTKVIEYYDEDNTNEENILDNDGKFDLKYPMIVLNTINTVLLKNKVKFILDKTSEIYEDREKYPVLYTLKTGDAFLLGQAPKSLELCKIASDFNIEVLFYKEKGNYEPINILDFINPVIFNPIICPDEEIIEDGLEDYKGAIQTPEVLDMLEFDLQQPMKFEIKTSLVDKSDKKEEPVLDTINISEYQGDFEYELEEIPIQNKEETIPEKVSLSWSTTSEEKTETHTKMIKTEEIIEIQKDNVMIDTPSKPVEQEVNEKITTNLKWVDKSLESEDIIIKEKINEQNYEDVDGAEFLFSIKTQIKGG